MQIIYSRKSEQKKPTSQYVGVNWDRQYGKWKACISVNSRKKILGYFDDELEAARCFNEAAKRHGRDTLNLLPAA